MAEDAGNPTAYAADIDAARERLISFVSGCGDEEWRAAPLDGDPRPVAVVVDHVAHAYEYLAGWISQLVAGQAVEVSTEIVDALNAQHARDAAAVSRAEATEHLRRSGDVISRLVAGLSAADLNAGDGRVRRLAQIAARHADDHRADIQAALTTQGIGGLHLAIRDISRRASAPKRSPIHSRQMRIFSQRAERMNIRVGGRQEFLMAGRRPARLVGNSVPDGDGRSHAELGELDVAVQLTVVGRRPRLHVSTLLAHVPLGRLII